MSRTADQSDHANPIAQVGISTVATTKPAVFSLDPSGVVLTWSSDTETITGYARDEVLGKHFAFLYPAEALEEDEGGRVLERALADHHWEEATLLSRRCHSPLWAVVSVTALFDAEDRHTGFLVVMRAIAGLPPDSKVHERTEDSMRDGRLFIHAMIESMPGILYFYDSTGRFLRWNRNFETVSGYSGAEIARMHPLDFFSEAEQPLLAQRIEEVFEKHESSVEANFISRDGTATRYFFTGRRVLFEKRLCLVGVGIDVSERRLAQDRLAESERKYRELVENANSIILRWNADGRITMLNEFGLRFFNYSLQDVVGRHVVGTLVPPTESGGRDLHQLMDDICSAPESFDQSVNENMRSNGERVWVAWVNRVVRDAEGRPIEILSIGTDITERRRAEQARRESEALYRTLFDYAPDGIVIADKESRYLDANESMCRMLGYRHDELVGMHASDIVIPEEEQHIHLAIEEIESHADHYREWRFRRKDGTIVEAEVIATLMPDGNMLGMIRDISERKQAEAERERRYQAEEADRIKSAFLATMSHELRTPLNSIIGFTGIIMQELAGPVNAEQRKQLGMVRTSARHLLALVNDVLDISKIEAGQFEVAREPFDLRASIGKVIDLLRPQTDAAGLNLQVTMPEVLGEAVGDARRFEQILLNLLSNAIKFTSEGSVALTAELVNANGPPGELAGRSAIRICVSDTGMGITRENLELLFQPFKQVDSGLARPHEGTGLGLAICHRLAVLMGGRIDVESEWGKGSTFTLTLPIEGPVVA
jgi:PAS domain S-box-containing protein